MLRLHRKLVAVEKPLAMAIGNFDGVHLGHQSILRTTTQHARARGYSSAALTFHPLPREFFTPAQAPARLMSLSEKLAAFASLGVAHTYVPRFNAAFAAQSPQAFIDSLVGANVRWLMVGEDFRFGAKRAGDVELLIQSGKALGFEVAVMPDADIDGMRISSSAVREALALGQLRRAQQMLGRDYAIIGRVTHGKKLGRTLGFPTANVALTGRRPALGGVFAVKCRLVTTRGLEGVAGDVGSTGDSEQWIDGVANLGTNPVVSIENRQHLEVFLFDVPASRLDLYGQRLEVRFLEKIRDELKLPSLDALVTQMHDDVAKAKAILSTHSADTRRKHSHGHP